MSDSEILPSATRQRIAQTYLAIWRNRLVNEDGIAIWVNLDFTTIDMSKHTLDRHLRLLLKAGWISKYAMGTYQLIRIPDNEKDD